MSNRAPEDRGKRLFRGAAVVVLATACIAPSDRCVAANAADALRIAARSRAVIADSVALATATSLERTPGVDSLALASAWCNFANARLGVSKSADSLAIAAATHCLGVRQRHLAAQNVEIAAAHEAVARALMSPGVERARTHLESAIQIRTRDPAPDDSLLANDWLFLAGTLRDLGDSRAAIRAASEALAIQERLWGREHLDIARTIYQIGEEQDDLDQVEDAFDSYTRALDMVTRLGGVDHVGRINSLTRLAALVEYDGDLSGGLRLQQEALRVAVVATGEDSENTATSRANLASKLMEFGDFASARFVFEQSVRDLETTLGPDHLVTALTRQSVAVASCVLGDAARARPILAQLEERWMQPRPGDRGFGIGTCLRWQAELLLREGRFVEAAAMAQRAIAEEERSRPATWSLGRSYAVRIHALEALNDSVALNAAARGLAGVQKSGMSTKSHIQATYWRARAIRQPGAGLAAFALALEADSLARSELQLQVRTLPDRRALQLSRERADFLELVVEIAASDLEPEYRVAAWERIVGTRGLVRSELENRRLAPELRADSSLIRLHAGWAEAQKKLARALVDSRAAQDPEARARVEAIQHAADNAEMEYAHALAARGAAAPQQHDPTLADVRGQLGPGQALVACFEFKARDDSSRLVAFIARAGEDRIDLVSFGSSSALRGLIDPWRRSAGSFPGRDDAARRRAERDCGRAGAAVRARVWEPIAAHLDNATEVFLVPDGPLLEFPWQALPDSDDRYLVESGPPVRIISAERDLMAQVRAGSRRSLLAVGAPDYDRDAGSNAATTTEVALTRGVADLCAQPERLALGPLPEAALEIESIARSWRSRPSSTATVLVGAEAHESNLKSKAAGRAILHIATHGVVVGDTCVTGAGATRGVGGLAPLSEPGERKKPQTISATAYVAPPSPWMGRRVWLALAGANRATAGADDENDGLLTAEEVVTLDIGGTDWVVLSACHSAFEETWSREGATGMRRAFELAGAQSVIASHWPVEDRATREWMEALYAARTAGTLGAAPAVQQASRTVLATRRQDKRSTHPFYWAAFSATGR